MLNISPHPSNFLRINHNKEYADIKNKAKTTICPSGPRVQCLDIAKCKIVTPQLLVSLNNKLNKLTKYKNDLHIESYTLRKSMSNVKETLNKVKIYFLIIILLEHLILY